MNDGNLTNQDEDEFSKEETSQIDRRKGNVVSVDSSKISANEADGNCTNGKPQKDGNLKMNKNYSHRNTILEEIGKLTLIHVMGCKKQSRPMSILEQKWNQMFDRLYLFKEKHGHCLVPNRYENDPALGAWVSTQRRQYKILLSGSSESTPMTAERASRLESLGFVWATNDPRHVPWEVRYKELCQYKDSYGDCLVPIGFKRNVKLANWVSTQRQEYKLLREGRSSRLTEDRIKMLQDIDFVWEAQRGGPRKRKLYLDSDLTKKLQEHPKGKKRNLSSANYENHKPSNTKSSIVNTIESERQANDISNKTGTAVNVFFQILPQTRNKSSLLTQSLSSGNSEDKLSNSDVLRKVPDTESTMIQLKVFSSSQKPETTNSSLIPGAEIMLPTSNNNVNLGLVAEYPQNIAITTEKPSATATSNMNSSENNEIDFNVISYQARSAMYRSLNRSEIAAAATLFHIEPLMRREEASIVSRDALNPTSEISEHATSDNHSNSSLDKTSAYAKRAVGTLMRGENEETPSPPHVSSFSPPFGTQLQTSVDQSGIYDDAEEDNDFFQVVTSEY